MQPKTQRISVKKLKPNPDNPRIVKDDKFAKLVKSIKDFPQMMELRPIVVDSNMVILGGNMRYKACVDAGMKEVPVVVAADLTDEQKKEFIIKDNLGYGEWDWDSLRADWDLDELENWGMEIPTSFTPEQIGNVEDNTEIDEVWNTDICPGDLFEFGPHRLLCGDSADTDAVARLMNGHLADLVFTDPPYGVAYKGKTKDALTIMNDDIDEQELTRLVEEWFNVVDVYTRPGAYLLATVPPGPLHLIFAQDWKSRGWLRQIMVWNKDSMVLGHSEYHYKHEPILFGWKEGKQTKSTTRIKNSDRTRTTVWDFARPKVNKEHPTMKPVSMWAYGITNHSFKNDIIYEPFSGSGTCFEACHRTLRKCYGMELDPKYCQVIVNRMHKIDPDIIIKRNGQPYNLQS